nr:septal ring lytic transglycosylase RlpA family protein [Campylobacter sp. 19-13652]
MVGCSTTQYLPSPSGSSEIKNSPAMHRATMRPYTVNGKTYYPTVVKVGEKASGTASWYGPDFHGKKTSNGEVYNMHGFTAAHKTLPMNTMLRVTNLKNNRQVVVRVNDRGPFVSNRIIDLSKGAASKIGMIGAGTAPVLLEVIGFNAKISGTSNIDTASNTPAKIEPINSNISAKSSVIVISPISKSQAQSEASADEVVGGEFMVQIGSFSSLSGAKSYQVQHKNVGGYQSIVREFNVSGRRIFKVFVTGFRSEDEARDFAKSGRFNGAFIVRG